jgi:tetratricopeptide (TPR) repeat protein
MSVGWSKNNIGNAFKGLGKYDEALKWYSEALTTGMSQTLNPKP